MLRENIKKEIKRKMGRSREEEEQKDVLVTRLGSGKMLRTPGPPAHP